MNPMDNQYWEIFQQQRDRSLELRSEPISERKKRLKAFRSWILTNKDRIRQAVFEDLQKSETDTDIAEIYTVTSELNKCIRNLSKWTKPKHVSPGMTYLGTSGWVKPEPKGVCLIIAPWNFPFNLMGNPLTSCLAAGNTAILKPSEHTPATSKLVNEMVAELFDPSIVTVVEGSVPETTELLKLPFNHIFFTGSTNVGKIVMEAASKNLASVTLELGGKSPVIIDGTANADDAAKKIVWGRFVNNGQTCIAPDYIFIDEQIKDQFIKSTSKYINQLFNPENKGIQQSEEYSRMVNQKQTDRVIELLEEAKSKGARVEIGGEYDAKDKFIEPTLVTSVDDQVGIWQQEIFGPVMPLNIFKNLDDVIDHINKNEKPLSLYMFTKSKKNRKKVETSTSSGGMVINDTVLHYAHPNLPFGGVNHSGIGKSHGIYGFKEFSNEKAVLKQRIGLTNTLLFYPPYNGLKKKIVDLVIKYF